MKTPANIWIALLTLTAVILGIMLIAAPSREAQAAMVNDQAGFTLLTSGTPGGDEFLYVIDKNTQKLVMYKFTGRTLELAARTDFARAFK